MEKEVTWPLNRRSKDQIGARVLRSATEHKNTNKTFNTHFKQNYKRQSFQPGVHWSHVITANTVGRNASGQIVFE